MWKLLPEALAFVASLGAVPAEHSREPDARGVELDWNAPPQCPDRTGVMGRIAQLLSGESSPSHRTIVSHATVEARERGGYELTITVDSGEGPGTRVVPGQTCEELADAAALLLAIAIEPELLRVEPEPEPQPEPKSPVEPAAMPSPSVPPPRQSPPEPKPTPRYGVRLGPGVGYNQLPDVGFGGRLTGAVLWPHARFEFGVTGWLPRVVVGRPGGVDSIRVWGATGWVHGCGVPTVGRRWEFPLCGGGFAGAMVGRGLNAPIVRRASQPWAGLTGSGGVGFALAPRWALAASVQAVIPLVRPGFELVDDGAFRATHRTGAAGVAGWLDVEFRWP